MAFINGKSVKPMRDVKEQGLQPLLCTPSPLPNKSYIQWEILVFDGSLEHRPYHYKKVIV